LPPPSLVLLERAAASLESYDWLVVASVRAVSAVVQARAGRPLPRGLRTAAVGEATAAALRAAGAAHVLVETKAGATDLLRVLPAADSWPGRRVLIPRAALGGHETAEAMLRLGARVDEVVAYRTAPRHAEEIAHDWREARPEAVVVTSPSAAAALVDALGPAALGSLDAVVAIGPTTPAALSRLGVEALVSPFADFVSVATRTRQALAKKSEP
jgi:uroporphyrinogen-III synthase